MRRDLDAEQNRPIEVDEVIFAKEAVYYMPYHELKAMVDYISNATCLPDSISENLDKWNKFLAEFC